MRYTKTVGIPTLFAVVLLWAVLFRSPATAEQLDTLGVKLEARQQTLVDNTAVQKVIAEKQLRFLYLMCLNTAGKNQQARDACESVLK